MKKLKTFAVQDATVLSRKEMAAIEGGLIIDALDNCSAEFDDGKPCVYYIEYNDDNRPVIALGRCYTQVDKVADMEVKRHLCTK